MGVTARGKIFAGLDIGSSRIKVICAEENNFGKNNILSFVKGLSDGLKKGNIIDIDAVMAKLNDAITQSEHFCGQEIREVRLAVSGVSIQTVRSHVAAAVTGEDSEVSPEDRRRLLLLAKNITLPEDKTILQIVERQYIVDGNAGVKDPVGMKGSRVELEAVLILVNILAVENLLKCISELGLEVSEMVYAPLFAAASVLSRAEQEMGAALIDLGAQKTELSIFRHGALEKSVVFPIGSDNITWDLAIVLKTSNEAAEALKENGDLLALKDEEERMLELERWNGSGVQQVSSRLAARVAVARLEELIQLLAREIFADFTAEELPGGVIVTGGGAKLKGVTGLFQRILGLPVRLGLPERPEHLFQAYRTPENAVVLGCAAYESRGPGNDRRNFSDPLERFFRRFTGWVRDFIVEQ